MHSAHSPEGVGRGGMICGWQQGVGGGVFVKLILQQQHGARARHKLGSSGYTERKTCNSCSTCNRLSN